MAPEPCRTAGVGAGADAGADAGIGDGVSDFLGAWATTGDKVKTGSELELPLSSTAENCSRAKTIVHTLKYYALMWTMPSIEAVLLRGLDLLHFCLTLRRTRSCTSNRLYI